MGIGSKFEAALRGMVEKPFAWLIRTGLNPNEFAPQIERAMEDHVRRRDVPGDEFTREAPTRYDIYLSDKDYEVFGNDARLVGRLCAQVIQIAKNRRYWLERNPVIRFYEDEGVPIGQMRVEPFFYDQVAAPSPVSVVDETRSMGPAEAQKLQEDLANAQARNPVNTSLPPAWLTLYRPARGQAMRLMRQQMRIGRDVSNDIVVDDPRVSRFHAEIRYEGAQFLLYDLGSTNGVRINGVRMRQSATPLRNNDLITVGNHEFVFQRR